MSETGVWLVLKETLPGQDLTIDSFHLTHDEATSRACEVRSGRRIHQHGIWWVIPPGTALLARSKSLS